jgi:hypothetical protein
VSKSKRTNQKAARGKAKPAARKPGKICALQKIRVQAGQSEEKGQGRTGKKSRSPKRSRLPSRKPPPRSQPKRFFPKSQRPKKKAPVAKPVVKKPVAKAPVPKGKTPPVKNRCHKAGTGPTDRKTGGSCQASRKVHFCPLRSRRPPKRNLRQHRLLPRLSLRKRDLRSPCPRPGPTKSGALFYDSHMHTPLCKHAWGEPEEYAQQALKAGLKGIIFTCHCPDAQRLLANGPHV